MAHPQLPHLQNWAPVVHSEGVFTAEECDRVLTLSGPMKDGDVVGPKPGYRDSRVSWIRPEPRSRWLFEKVRGLVQAANANHYRMDLAGFTEPMQLGEYGPGQHYDYHLDYGNDRFSIRKLSFVVQLTDPAEYQGGEVEVLAAKEPTVAPRGRGTMICFPSYILHRVCAVTEGVRHSLVGWIGGPPLR